MTPQNIIDIVCQTLELDKQILTGTRFTRNGAQNSKEVTPQTREYCEGRYICARLIRKHFEINYSKPSYLFKKQLCEFTYREIGEFLGLLLKDGSGDNAAAIYCERICLDLLNVKDKKFTIKYVNCEVKLISESVAEIPDNNFIKSDKK